MLFFFWNILFKSRGSLEEVSVQQSCCWYRGKKSLRAGKFCFVLKNAIKIINNLKLGLLILARAALFSLISGYFRMPFGDCFYSSIADKGVCAHLVGYKQIFARTVRSLS